MLKLVSHLNTFDQTIRQKLSKIDEKLNKLERSVDYIETIKASERNSKNNKNTSRYGGDDFEWFDWTDDYKCEDSRQSQKELRSKQKTKFEVFIFEDGIFLTRKIIDVADCLIIKWLKNLKTNGSKEKIDNKRTWLE